MTRNSGFEEPENRLILVVASLELPPKTAFGLEPCKLETTPEARIAWANHFANAGAIRLRESKGLFGASLKFAVHSLKLILFVRVPQRLWLLTHAVLRRK